MSIFVTQSLDSSVTVLVFARPGSVVDAIRTQLQTKRLEVVVVDPLQFSSSQSKELEQHTFYKVLWVLDDTIKGSPAADNIFQFLFTRSEPVMILTAVLGGEELGSEAKAKKEGDTQLLNHLQTYINAVFILSVENWLDQPQVFTSALHFYPDVQKASRGLQSGVFTDQVVAEVVRRLIRPHAKGQQTVAQRRSFGPEELTAYLPLETVSEQTSIEFIATETTVQTTGFYQEEAAFLQTTEHPLAWEIEEFEKRHREVSVRVFPLPAPKIINRQRLYEENISRIKHRYQKERLLRPVPRREIRRSTLEEAEQKKTNPQLHPVEKNLEVTIQQLFGSQRQEQRESRLQKKAIKTVKAQRKQARQKRVMRALSALILLGVLVGSVFASFVWMRSQLFALILNQDGSENLADQEVWQSWKTQTLVKALATEIQAYQFFAGSDSLPETSAVVSAAHQMQTIHQQRQQLKTLGTDSVEQVLGKKSGSVFETVTALSAQQQTLYSSLSVIQTQLQSLSTEFMDDRDKEAVEKILAEIQQARRQVATFEQIRQMLPAFLAQNERRRVAIVLQDSQELRPSGGLVQGVYLITLEKGVIIDQQFYDPAQIEGNKSATIPAPTDYQRYFNQTNLQLIDAGWGADFTETATIINGMLEHSLGRKGDLVVGVTTDTMQKIIAQTGPLVVEETRETLTDKNFYERLDSHPEPSYLRTVFVSLVDRLLQEPAQASQALSVLSTDLQNGQIFLVSAEPTENEVLNSLGWAGQVSTPQCPTLLEAENCQISTLYQLESNIGLNKVGPFIQREIRHRVDVGRERLHHQRTVTLTNQSSTTRWPGGAYRDYMRFYIPSGSEVLSVRVGETQLDTRNLERGETKSGQYIGFVVDVPVRSSVDVSFEYQQEFKYQEGIGLAFFDQKQAGTSVDDYSLIITPKEGLQAAVVAPKAKIENGSLAFDTPREKHQFVGVKFR